MSLTDKSDIEKENYKHLLNCIHAIQEEPKSYEFRQPVKWKELGFTDYPKIVKKPMDLSTLKTNLEKKKY